MERRSVPCVEDGAEAFAASSVVVLMRKVGSARGKAKYEVKVKKADDCSVVDLIPETTSLTSKEIMKLLKKAGLTPGEIEKYLEWARKLMSGPDKDEVAALFRKVVEAAKAALSGRLDSPYLDLHVPKRDKESLTNCKPSECWKSANAAAVVPAKIDGRFGILDFDSKEALRETESLGFDPKRHMHILAGPAVDAVLTPEGKWRTPDGRVLDDVSRKLHVPVFIPEGCRRDLKAPGFELKCREAVNITGRHPSGAEYEFVDGELLEVSLERVKEFAEALAGYGDEVVEFPECRTIRRVDVDKLTELFSRIYSSAQVAGYSRHDVLYDLGILCRLSCVPKEDVEEVARRVYNTAGGESQTLSQRLSHIERAYRASEDGGPKPRPPDKIYETWRKIDETAAEEIFKLLDIDLDGELAKECLGDRSTSVNDYIDEELDLKSVQYCKKYVVAEIMDGRLVIAEMKVSYRLVKNKKTGEVDEVEDRDRDYIYIGPRPKLIYDVVRGLWMYEIGGLYGTSIEQVVEKLKRAGAHSDVYIKTSHIDEIVMMLKKVAKRQEAAITVGLLPTKRGVVLVDDFGILDVGPSFEDAVADLDKALRSVVEAYPEANRDAALASVGYVLGLNAAPFWWFHKPHAEVPLPIIYGASGLGKSELMRRVVEPAVVGANPKARLLQLRDRIADEVLHDYLNAEIRKEIVYSTPEQFRNDLDANTLVLILDEQKPGDPRNPRAPAKIFGKYWLQVATAEWGRRISQHAARYGGGFGYKFFRLRAFAVVTNYSPDEWKRAGLADDSTAVEGAVDRRVFEIPWEDVKFDASKLDLIYTPRYSVLKVLEVTINKHFEELISQSRFPEFIAALWRKTAEDFEPKLGSLDGIKAMVAALEKMIQYNRERSRFKDPVAAAWEEVRRNALTYLREVAKITDLSPSKLVAKVVEYAPELGIVFRRPRWADEVDEVRVDFCRAVAKAAGRDDFNCSVHETTAVESMGEQAPPFSFISNPELRGALWKLFATYGASGYAPSILANSVLWPKNTKMLGRIQRTTHKTPGGGVEYYYKLSWQDFLDIFVGKLVAEDHQISEEYATPPGAGVIGGDVVIAPTPLTNLENQATNIETAPPAGLDVVQAHSGITTPPPAAEYKVVVDDTAAASPAVVSPQVPLTQVDGHVEEAEAGAQVGQRQRGITTEPHTATIGVVSPPSALAESRVSVEVVEPTAAVYVDVSQGQRGITTPPPITPANQYNIGNKKDELHGGAEACLANPICRGRLTLCIWKHLKVPKEEKKAALYAEIERHGELFAYCLKDAVEYAKRESEL